MSKTIKRTIRRAAPQKHVSPLLAKVMNRQAVATQFDFFALPIDNWIQRAIDGNSYINENGHDVLFARSTNGITDTMKVWEGLDTIIDVAECAAGLTGKHIDRKYIQHTTNLRDTLRGKNEPTYHQLIHTREEIKRIVKWLAQTVHIDQIDKLKTNVQTRVYIQIAQQAQQ